MTGRLRTALRIWWAETVALLWFPVAVVDEWAVGRARGLGRIPPAATSPTGSRPVETAGPGADQQADQSRPAGGPGESTAGPDRSTAGPTGRAAVQTSLTSKERLHGLRPGDARLEHLPALDHPAWCDPHECGIYPEGDGTIAIFHQARLLKATIGYRKWLVVDLMKSATLSPRGDLLRTATHLYIDGATDGVEPEHVAALASALARAAELTGMEDVPS